MRTKKIKRSFGEKVFDTCNFVFLGLISLTTIYPFIYIAAVSLSSVPAVIRGDIFFWPQEFTIEGYQMIFRDGEILRAYYNTVWYTAVGTVFNVFFTMLAAYPLSRKYFTLRSPIMLFVAITMFFSGGMVPSYILINQLGLPNTRWVMFIPFLVSAWNLILARVYLQSTIPDELNEAAKIDGASELRIFFRIVLPLSPAIIAVISLYYAVDHWNDFTTALFYINDPELVPLALFLRRLLILNVENNTQSALSQLNTIQNQGITTRFRYGAVIITMLPIMLSYPFLQRYFIKGVMVGALKE